MLTPKQLELLKYIEGHVRKRGVSPSFDEMKDALGLKSKSGIHRLITGLEERGFIRRLPHRARALEILRLPENFRSLDPTGDAADRGFSPNVIEGGYDESRDDDEAASGMENGIINLGGGPDFQVKGQDGWSIQDDFTFTGLEWHGAHALKIGAKFKQSTKFSPG